jgi:hypothetical protein
MWPITRRYFQRFIRSGVYVVSIGDTLLVKRVDFDEVKKAITLISANPGDLLRVIAGKDLESVKIEGRAIACLHGM